MTHYILFFIFRALACLALPACLACHHAARAHFTVSISVFMKRAHTYNAGYPLSLLSCVGWKAGTSEGALLKKKEGEAMAAWKTSGRRQKERKGL